MAHGLSDATTGLFVVPQILQGREDVERAFMSTGNSGFCRSVLQYWQLRIVVAAMREPELTPPNKPLRFDVQSVE